MTKKILIAAIIPFLFITCVQNTSDSIITGKWQAIQLMEEDSLIEINTDEIRLSFDSDGRYLFESTLNYKEAGRYRHQNKLIYLKDTTTENKKEIAIRLLEITNDSLAIEMKEGEKKRVLSMRKL